MLNSGARLPSSDYNFTYSLINDLVVNSRDSKLEYLGKGIAEMIAVELVKSRSISLIAREKRNKLLEESEFSNSDLADPDSQVELGRMLAARCTLLNLKTPTD